MEAAENPRRDHELPIHDPKRQYRLLDTDPQQDERNILIERSRESEQATVKESLDYVNPKECDAIQQFRIHMRLLMLR